MQLIATGAAHHVDSATAGHTLGWIECGLGYLEFADSVEADILHCASDRVILNGQAVPLNLSFTAGTPLKRSNSEVVLGRIDIGTVAKLDTGSKLS